MPADPFADPSFKALLTELARDSLTAQHDILKELRTGAGMLLAATSLVASFLGSEVLDRAGLTVIASLAIAAFAVALFATLFVLAPRPQVRSDVPVNRLVHHAREVERDPHDVLVDLVEKARRVNAPALRSAATGYKIALTAACVQICLWVGQLLATM